MSDAYVYLFKGWNRLTGDEKPSGRQATLEAIKGKGDAIMESQTLVDHSELDGDGFFIPVIGKNSSAVNELTAQIKSVELRAASRDSEALKLNDTTEGKDKYMLSLESRELRNQARKLTKQRVDAISDDRSILSDPWPNGAAPG